MPEFTPSKVPVSTTVNKPMAKIDIFAPILPHEPGDLRRWSGLHGSSLSLAVANVAKVSDGIVVLITANTEEAELVRRELGFFCPDRDVLPVHTLPDWETLPYDNFSAHQDIVSDRLNTLYHLPLLKRGILIVPVTSLMHRLTPRDYVVGNSLMLKVGTRFEPETMRRNLLSAGYHCVDSVYEHGEFAVRGSIMDIFPMGSDMPYRIDLFDDEIETLRTFDPESQRSLEKVRQVQLLPGKEYPMNEAGISLFRNNFRNRFDVDLRHVSVYQDISQGLHSAGIEYYLPLFFEQLQSLFDYLPEKTLVLRSGDLDASSLRFWNDIKARHEDRCHDLHRPILKPSELFLSPDEALARLRDYPSVELQSLAIGSRADIVNVDVPPELNAGAQHSPLPSLQTLLTNHPDSRVLFCAETAGRRESMLEMLKTIGITPTPVESWQAFLDSDQRLSITVAPIDRGLCLQLPLHLLITETQLFGQRVAQRRRRRKVQDNTEFLIRNLTELHIGAAVVHLEHGVGRYRGLQTLTIEGQETEFLTLEYAREAKLYVPVYSLHLISRYGGSEPELAPLNQLGNDQWQKARSKAAEKIRDVAVELLDIYARREARQGFQYRCTDIDYENFAASFPFEETADQQDAIAAVMRDMGSTRAMDRLVCGDVGFGKTEVAMRAAFIAVQNNKQVAILVPTTLLAQQHYESFKDRFADWPVSVDLISRFRSTKQVQDTLDRIRSGKVDIVVGTHKLLQDNIVYKDLGLLIIDDEHRFGVQQKEKLKAIRADVDILTLTATPIPRTLNMAMSGVRDLSLIVTPPAKRLSVKTFIRESQDSLIKEAVLRELLRGGQVFYLHNEVKTINKTAEDLQELIPEARVCVAHGQLPERDLEQIMADFYHKRYNILVCSTIIETGIDIPSANTIIMDRADKLGLAQLHQLRGRVGRSHHQAYAYLLTPNKKNMTADASKRIEAISAASTLGAGFTLASHDLEIRGAGEILGEEQTGHMQKIGFTLYTEMLDEAVKAIREGRTPNIEASLQNISEVNLRIPALIPEEYLPDIHTRLIMYKRIAGAKNDEEIGELQVEMIDRFGLLPDQTKLLFKLTALRLRAQSMGISKIDANTQTGKLSFSQTTRVDPRSIVQLVQQQPKVYKLSGSTQLHFTHNAAPGDKRIEFINGMLGLLKLGQ
ncbi:MAG: transcription-repair coupling factor [Gammaproteobacteria bacterium]|nr:transcription-repair coupling factor [Gammaproteobacteria bacterium]